MSDSIAPDTTEPTPDAPDGGLDAAPTSEDYAKLESAIKTVMDGDSPEDGDDGGDIAKARRQAANYRTQLRETQAERDQLRDSLTGQMRAVIDWRAAHHPSGALDPALLDAAGLDMTELADEAGNLDMAKVDDFIEATAARFSVRRAFKPNRAQGVGGSPDVQPSLADAFRRK